MPQKTTKIVQFVQCENLLLQETVSEIHRVVEKYVFVEKIVQIANYM